MERRELENPEPEANYFCVSLNRVVVSVVVIVNWRNFQVYTLFEHENLSWKGLLIMNYQLRISNNTPICVRIRIPTHVVVHVCMYYYDLSCEMNGGIFVVLKRGGNESWRYRLGNLFDVDGITKWG